MTIQAMAREIRRRKVKRKVNRAWSEFWPAVLAFLTVAAEGRTPNDGAALVFERHGSAMFLSAVRLRGDQVRVLLGSDLRPAHAALKSAALASPVLH